MPRPAKSAFAILLMTCLSAHAALCDPASPLPQWNPSETALAIDLQPDAVQFQCGSLNLPNNWKLRKTETFASKRELYTFGNGEFYKVQRRTGPIGPGLCESLTVTTEIAGGVGPDWTPEAGIADATAPITDRLFNMKATNFEHGMVRGRPAIRCYVSGDYDLEPGRHTLGSQSEGHQIVPVHVFAYVIGDADINTSFVAFDLDPNSKTNLPKLEQSVLTFQQASLDGPASGQPKAPSGWTADPASFKYLRPSASYGGVSLCAPKFGGAPAKMSYSDPATGKPLAGLTGYIWLVNGSQTSPGLLLKIDMLKPGEAPPSLEDFVTSLAENAGGDLDGYTHSKPEYGYTGFGRTARFYGGGKLTAGKGASPEQMAVYAFVSGNAVVYLKAFDDAPGHAWLPCLENAILTGSIPGAEKAPALPPPAAILQAPPDGAPLAN